MSREWVGRHERRPQLETDRELIRRRAAARVQQTYTGRHRVTS